MGIDGNPADRRLIPTGKVINILGVLKPSVEPPRSDGCARAAQSLCGMCRPWLETRRRQEAGRLCAQTGKLGSEHPVPRLKVPGLRGWHEEWLLPLMPIYTDSKIKSNVTMAHTCIECSTSS